jgi:uncharacterized PurR-regulated membrane protein YhhQ (DUF165 family)
MHTTTNDRALDDALRAELEHEPPMIRESLGVFAGRRRAWHIAAAIVVFVFFAFAVFCAVRLFGATEAAERVLWGVGVLLGMLMVMSIKIYFWLQLVRNALLRAIARVELRLADPG